MHMVSVAVGVSVGCYPTAALEHGLGFVHRGCGGGGDGGDDLGGSGGQCVVRNAGGRLGHSGHGGGDFAVGRAHSPRLHQTVLQWHSVAVDVKWIATQSVQTSKQTSVGLALEVSH